MCNGHLPHCAIVIRCICGTLCHCSQFPISVNVNFTTFTVEYIPYVALVAIIKVFYFFFTNMLYPGNVTMLFSIYLQQKIKKIKAFQSCRSHFGCATRFHVFPHFTARCSDPFLFSPISCKF